MLQATVALAQGGHQEHIALHRRRPAKEIDVMLADALHVAGQPRQVGAVTTGDYNLMGYARRPEAYA